MRIPALIQQTWSWPAWVMMFFARRLWPQFLAIPVIAFAILRTVLAVAWSEYYPPFVPLYRMVLENQFEFILIGLGVAVIFGWVEDWRAGLLISVASIAAIWYLTHPPSVPTFSRLDTAMRPIVHFPERGPEVSLLVAGFGLATAFAMLFVKQREAIGGLTIATVLILTFSEPFPRSRYAGWYLASLVVALPLSFPWRIVQSNKGSGTNLLKDPASE